MDPRLIDGIRRGQATARDEALARLLVERKILAEEDVDTALDVAPPGGLGASLVEAGRVSPELQRELEHALRVREVMDAVMGARETAGSAPQRIGRYEVLEMIGRGAVGEVFKAHDPTLGRDVAIKLLARDDTYVLQRFLREARILAQLQHPGIPRIHEVDQYEGRVYLAIEYVSGTSLQSARVPRRRAAEIIRDAALVVQYAHEQEVVHRDLKPANILADDDGRVFVLDFGLAKAFAAMPALTKTGELLGTPAYMAPEQAQGFPADARSDVYGLGATLYWLLAAAPPYSGRDPMDVARRVAATPPEPLPEVDGLADIVGRAMARERRGRYETASALADALDGFLTGREGLPREPRSWWRRLFARRPG